MEMLIKKKWISFILILCLAAGNVYFSSAAAGNEPPVVIFAMWNASPGQAVGIYGDFFGSMDGNGKTNTSVVLLPLTGFAGELSADKATVNLSLVNVESGVIQAIIPSDAPKDMYAGWVKTDAGVSKPFFINRPEAFWVSERTVYPGQKIRIAGRNFVNPNTDSYHNAAVKLVSTSDGSVISAKIADASPYTIDIEILGNISYNQELLVMH